MNKKDSSAIKWHPAFLQAVQSELFDYRDALEYRTEYQLTAEPLRVDLLIIKKTRQITIDKNIARIFRKDNILEYKSPNDYFSVKDFQKVYAYANLYAAITPDADLSEITLTYVGSKYPNKLIQYLKDIRQYKVEETSPGIHLVLGDYIPIQIIESKKLPRYENLWLNSMTNDLEIPSLSAIFDEDEKHDHKLPLDAYLDVLLEANPEIFLEVYKMKKRSATFEEVFTKAGIIPQWIERGRIEGRVEGQQENALKTARKLKARGYPLFEIAEDTGLSLEIVEKLV